MALRFKHPILRQALLTSAITTGIAFTYSGILQAEAQPAGANKTIDEVYINARRREESAQDTPVSASAFDSDAIYRKNISEIDDVMHSVPGVNFTASGGANNVVFSIRGRSRGVFGNALPAVTTYVNDVPLSTWGGNIPAYDMSSIQVLKGPQGTLFGRNSTAGAVLVNTKGPSHERDGYLMGKVGAYHAQVLEGAINVPLIKDILAVRFAGQSEERQGHTEDMMNRNFDDYGNRNRENYRVSLLFEPIENLSNILVYEQNKLHERSQPVIPVGYVKGARDFADVGAGLPITAIGFTPYYNGGTFLAPTGANPGEFGGGYKIDPANPLGPPIICGGDPSCNIEAAVFQQAVAGVRKSFADFAGYTDQELNSVSNTTALDLGPVTLKNIFGYRKVFTHSVNDIDGLPFPMISTDNVTDIRQFTNEFQVSGELFDNTVEYIGGVFFLKSEPDGGNRLAIQAFAQEGTPFNGVPDGLSDFGIPGGPDNGTDSGAFANGFGPSDYYKDKSIAVFGQVSIDLLDWFSVDLGVRDTTDWSENCPIGATFAGTQIPDENLCFQKVKAKFNKTTYNAGLNFQITDDVLVYAATRTGYRAGGVNSPVLAGSLTPFQSYKPETVEDFELGLKTDWTLGSVVGRTNIALYRSEFEGVHYAIPTQAIAQLLPGGVDGDSNDANDPTGGIFYGNAGDATVEGVEAELIIQPLESLELGFSGAYLDKELDANITLPQNFIDNGQTTVATPNDVRAFVFLGAPRWSYTANAAWTLPCDESHGEMILSAKYFRISDIHYGAEIYAGAYEITDVRADWNRVNGSAFDFAVYVANVFDKEAIVGPSSSSAGLGINSALYNDPRMWGASLRYNFGEAAL